MFRLFVSPLSRVPSATNAWSLWIVYQVELGYFSPGILLSLNQVSLDLFSNFQNFIIPSCVLFVGLFGGEYYYALKKSLYLSF